MCVLCFWQRRECSGRLPVEGAGVLDVSVSVCGMGAEAWLCCVMALGAGEAVEREKRSEEPPISLDLTFHLLREVLEMARAEQLAQQAHSNRKLMEIIGK
uniref:Corticotropin releasing hormone n=1 Tax=Meleagris gallopavo TaxID=9103 RepID=A0A803XQZ3_MELGA